MKGDCTRSPGVVMAVMEGDHPQMKGDCTETGA